jgi:hypothetical protein
MMVQHLLPSHEDQAEEQQQSRQYSVQQKARNMQELQDAWHACVCHMGDTGSLASSGSQENRIIACHNA